MKVLGAVTALFAACAFAEPARTVTKVIFTREPIGTPTTPTPALNSISVFEILATALPKSLLNLAITNKAAASSLIASEFAAGNTPAWFSNLPKDVQTYLVPVTTVKLAPNILSAFPTKATDLQPLTSPIGVSPSSSSFPTMSRMNMTMGMNMTMHMNMTMSRNMTMMRNTSTMSSSSSSSKKSTKSTKTTTTSTKKMMMTSGMSKVTFIKTSSKGDAALPTAMLGAGIAGAMGVLGMLAL